MPRSVVYSSEALHPCPQPRAATLCLLRKCIHDVAHNSHTLTRCEFDQIDTPMMKLVVLPSCLTIRNLEKPWLLLRACQSCSSSCCFFSSTGHFGTRWVFFNSAWDGMKSVLVHPLLVCWCMFQQTSVHQAYGGEFSFRGNKDGAGISLNMDDIGI